MFLAAIVALNVTISVGLLAHNEFQSLTVRYEYEHNTIQQCIEYNAYIIMHRIQCIAYNAYNTMHRIQCIFEPEVVSKIFFQSVILVRYSKSFST